MIWPRKPQVESDYRAEARKENFRQMCEWTQDFEKLCVATTPIKFTTRNGVTFFQRPRPVPNPYRKEGNA